MACAEEARARNLPRGTERRDFMRACMATQG
jgi:psiF repeat